jgi:hypothetical protein
MRDCRIARPDYAYSEFAVAAHAGIPRIGMTAMSFGPNQRQVCLIKVAAGLPSRGDFIWSYQNVNL